MVPECLIPFMLDCPKTYFGHFLMSFVKHVHHNILQLWGINNLPRHTVQPSSMLWSCFRANYLLRPGQPFEVTGHSSNILGNCNCSVASLFDSSHTIDIHTGVMYGDVLYGNVKTFLFHLFMWVDPAEYICVFKCSPYIYFIFKNYVVVPLVLVHSTWLMHYINTVSEFLQWLVVWHAYRLTTIQTLMVLQHPKTVCSIYLSSLGWSQHLWCCAFGLLSWSQAATGSTERHLSVIQPILVV